MLQQLESAKSKWGGKSHVIDRWLMDRQALLVSFCELAGINKNSECLPDADEIASFCSALLDYLSAGHFEIFDILVENDKEGLDFQQWLIRYHLQYTSLRTHGLADGRKSHYQCHQA